MDTRPPIEAPNESPVLSVAFNQDASRFAVGLPTGFCIYLSRACKLQISRDLKAGIGLAQMMGNANYVALVGGGRAPKFPQNKVIIWDDSKGKTALEITTLTAVRGVQLSKTRVVVVLQNSVRVYAFEKHPKPLAIYETADNLQGLCCLSDRYLVFPGRILGQVQVVHLETDSVSIIPAHNSSLKALQLSTDGELLATASEKGTIIRIYSTSSCARIAERRRGTDSATIFSLRFSPSGSMLACTSDKGNLHIFDVPIAGQRRPSSSSPQPPGSPGRAQQLQPQSGSAAGGAAAISPLGTSPGETRTSKWGFLSSIPFGPFADVYSFASAPFDSGQEPMSGQGGGGGGTTLIAGGGPSGTTGGGNSPFSGHDHNAVLGTTARPMKGIIGWLDERTLAVVGAGVDARWEKFLIVESSEGSGGGGGGGLALVREGWKRYMSS
ncbi:WD40-repeat-containing domain protein [Microdochium trichocladiopsis]|uniref:WD40-repeat-containing domain protein n=1 Tax=Microdochium trichocladiopsis TaxID=1682393 RepID=A0A9P9BS41_9PEZI|nr:WD40-repeat-containing domain protein [Microdochium trichocladiopsis]KAH7037510.1 WD40-repeat-containing domain protein [Microdochium trichocladiopsis]